MIHVDLVLELSPGGLPAAFVNAPNLAAGPGRIIAVW